MKYYSENHEWVEVIGDEAIIGISEYAADELGEISRLELPSEDDDFIIGDHFCRIEAENDSRDFCAPISGTVIAVNESLEDELELINEFPEERGWLCRFSDIDNSEFDALMDEEEYGKYLDELEG